MLTLNDLKDWLHRDLSATDKLLIVLAHLNNPSKLNDIRNVAREAGWSLKGVSNPSQLLKQSKGKAISNGSTWELTERGKAYLKKSDVPINDGPSKTTARDLRLILTDIKNQQAADFVEEAIQCCEAKLNRAAVVMSWLAAAHTLQTYVFNNHLADFNKEVRRVYPDWKDAKTLDDFGKLREAEFLDRIAAISVIGKNVKEKLKVCLDDRNACGHPNSYKIGENNVRSHIETLINNVFQPFAT